MVIREPGYGHCPAYTDAHFHSCVRGAPGQVPAECFPSGTLSQGLTSPRRVSFANSVTVLGDAPPLVHSLDISVQEPLRSEVVEEYDMDTGGHPTSAGVPVHVY